MSGDELHAWARRTGDLLREVIAFYEGLPLRVKQAAIRYERDRHGPVPLGWDPPESTQPWCPICDEPYPCDEWIKHDDRLAATP